MRINKKILREVLNNGRFEWSKHVLQRLAERDIPQKAVIDALTSGEEIERCIRERRK